MRKSRKASRLYRGRGTYQLATPPVDLSAAFDADAEATATFDFEPPVDDGEDIDLPQTVHWNPSLKPVKAVYCPACGGACTALGVLAVPWYSCRYCGAIFGKVEE